MKYFLLSIGIVLLSLRSFSQSDQFLIPFTDSSSLHFLVGYKNQQGEIIIPPKYHEKLVEDTLFRFTITVQPAFSNDSSPIQTEIGESTYLYCGELKTALFQDYVVGMTYTILNKNVIDGKIGFTNSLGEQVIQAKYSFIGPFNHGFAPYYSGGKCLFYNGSWFWDGHFDESGYIDKQGQEYTTKRMRYDEDGKVEEIIYRWNGLNCQSAQEVITLYKNETIKMRTSIRVNEACSEQFFNQIIYSEDGQVVHIEKKVNGKLDEEYRIGHYDYFYDSTGLVRIYEWNSIHTLWKEGQLLDIMSTDVLFLDAHNKAINEKKIIKLINSGKFDWWYTYIPIAIYTSSGQRIRFLIHKKPTSSKALEKLEKRKKKIIWQYSERYEK